MLKNEDYSVNKYIKILFYAIFAVILVGFVCIQFFYPSERDEETLHENLTYNGELVWEKQDGQKETIEAPGSYDVTPGNVMVITSVIPQDYDEEIISIRSSQQVVRFYIDGELREEYDTKDTRPFGSDSASRYIFCKTSVNDAGKELRIELLSNSTMYSGVVNEILCGNKIDIWQYIFNKYSGNLITAFFILFAGILAIIFSIALSIAYRTEINLKYLGWCMVLGAVWMIGESKLRQVFVSNASSLASLCFIVIMLCPVPVLLYVDSLQRGRYRKVFEVIEWIAIANLVISSILQMAEVADYLDWLSVDLFILAATFITVFVTFFLDYRKGKIKEYLLIVIGLLIGMLGALIESVSVYFVVSISGVFLGFGLIVLLFFALISTIKDIRKLENRRQQRLIEDRRKQAEAMSLQMINTLSTMIEEKNKFSKGHSSHVAGYSFLIAKKLGWSDSDAESLKNAVYLHDIGNIGIPDAIHNKPGRLLDEEYEAVKKHTVIGADILKNITLIEHAEEVARYHHERYDGTGYPEGLSGEEIPVYARIAAIAECYDAMKSKRPYRDALSKEEIREKILQNRGSQFDPEITDAFISLLDEDKLQNDDVSDGLIKDKKHEMVASGTMEASMFISDIMDTMKSLNDSENIDYLTGLPMRNMGESKISQEMSEHAGCLVFLDMDNLKKINDIYGHKSGDRVLKLLGDTIREKAVDSSACRLGGDEFLFFIKDDSKDEVSRIVNSIFDTFNEQKDKDVEIREASLSGGLCMSEMGDSFEECYSKADKALYYIKQNGKNSFSFYHQIEQDNRNTGVEGKDLEQIARALCDSGSYTGALDLDNREFSKIYEYMSNLGKRYKHTCHLAMITMEVVSDDTMFIEKIEQALGCMETAVRMNIRNVDICTRYSSMQFLLILMEAGKDNVPLIMNRIFTQYQKLYPRNDFRPHYEFMPMSDKE